MIISVIVDRVYMILFMHVRVMIAVSTISVSETEE